jgi:hypothetical protein
MNNDGLMEEVLELTSMLKNSSSLKELRLAILEQGIDPLDAFLVSFFEDEMLNEYGVIVSKDGSVYEYERNNDKEYSKTFDKWGKIYDVEKAKIEYPQISIALALLKQ